MADTKIRGVTIELGGDASGLDKALGDVNKNLNNTQKQLRDVDRLLKLDPKNTELLRQKQQLLGTQIVDTSKKLEALKKAQDTMDENGVDKNSGQYMALQREIVSTQKDLEKLRESSKQTASAMNGIKRAADGIASATEKAAKKTKAMSGAAGGALAALGGMAYKAVTNADDLNTLAKQTGFSTAELQKFQYASDRVDVSMEDITGAAAKMKKQLGSSESKFTDVGIATRKTDGSLRDVNDIFYDTIKYLSTIDNETERDTAAMDFFGRGADSLAGIIDDGGQSLREMGQEAEELGLIMSQNTLDSLNAVNDEIDRVKAQSTATLLQTGAKAMETLLPFVEKLIGYIDIGLGWLSSLNEEQLQTIITILAIVAALSPLLSLISGISTAISFLMANPIVFFLAAIIALIAKIAIKGDEMQARLQRFDDWLQGVFAKDWTEVFGPVLGGELNAFFGLLKSVWDRIKEFLDGIIDFIRGIFTGDIERVLKGLAKMALAIFRKPINGIINLINWAIDGINGLIRGVNAVGNVLGFTIGEIGHIPMLASGGVLSSGSAIVGEAGPELLTMNQGRAVVQPLTSGRGAGGAQPAAAALAPMYITVQSVLDGRVIAQSTTEYQERAALVHG